MIELLRPLPYLEAAGESERLLVYYETVPIACTKDATTTIEKVFPLPSRCVYLTEGVDCEGYSLILNIEKGALASSSTGSIGYGAADTVVQARSPHLVSAAMKS